MKRTVNPWDKLKRAMRAYTVLVLGAATVAALSAQTFTGLFSFDGADGSRPEAALVQGADGNLYGTTYEGGAHNYGTVFKIAPGGTLTTLYSFCTRRNCTDGEFPTAGLAQATNGDFYGTTLGGGVYGHGIVFRITSSGALTTLYSFGATYTDGYGVFSALTQAANGDFYGTTEYGGASGDGTVFKITPSGTLTTLYSFCTLTGCTDGSSPSAGLVQATNGDFYGTTDNGGASTACSGGCGTVFKITASGILTTLYSFCIQSGCTDGDEPNGLIQAANGDFYGTTYDGGANRARHTLAAGLSSKSLRAGRSRRYTASAP